MIKTNEAAESASPLTLASSRKTEHLFYLGYTVLVWLVAIVSFSPSFYLRGLVPSAAPLPPMRIDMIIHGVAATLFMSALPVQAWLVASGHRALHMRLGKPIFLLAVVFALSGYIANAMTFRDLPRIPVDPSFLATVAVLTIASFALMAFLAWRRRFDGQSHKRLIVCMGIFMLGPGLARILVAQSGLPPPLVGLANLALLLPLWLWDFVTRRRPHWSTLVGTAVFVAQNVLLGALAAAPLGSFVQLLPLYGWP
jgi:hypothetical protein